MGVLSVENIALMRAIPRMVVLSPADGTETKKMVFAVAKYKELVYLRMGRLDTEVLFDDNYDFQIGKINILTKGTGVTIAATGLLVEEALKAQKELVKEGISVGYQMQEQ